MQPRRAGARHRLAHVLRVRRRPARPSRTSPSTPSRPAGSSRSTSTSCRASTSRPTSTYMDARLRAARRGARARSTADAAFLPASVAARGRAMMSPWMLANRLSEADFAARHGAVARVPRALADARRGRAAPTRRRRRCRHRPRGARRAAAPRPVRRRHRPRVGHGGEWSAPSRSPRCAPRCSAATWVSRTSARCGSVPNSALSAASAGDGPSRCRRRLAAAGT